MSKRLALAYDALGDAYKELSEALFAQLEGGAGEGPPPPPAAAAFSSARPAETKDVGNCPIHGYPFKTTKKDGTPTRPYCSSKMPDGSWCKERPA